MSASLVTVRTKAPLVLHRTVESMRTVRKSLDPKTTVGFVPTMGALHEGHLSLVGQAHAENDVVVASIFVNPTQFAPGEDLEKYPRQLERDTELLSELGVDHLFAPEPSSMYGPNHSTYVLPEGFDEIAEGRARPGHFRGVATIVTKLFNIVKPTHAYFGQKDAAQCVVIRRMVEDLDFDIEISVLDTIREADGLAMSSRNAYLTAEERTAAPVLYQSLSAAKNFFDNYQESDTISGALIRSTVEKILRQEPLISKIEYIAIDSNVTMRPLENVKMSEGAIISLACRVGKVRLIDNIVLKPSIV